MPMQMRAGTTQRKNGRYDTTRKCWIAQIATMNGFTATVSPNARKARLAIALGGLFMALGNQAKPETGESLCNPQINALASANCAQWHMR